ncbi:MAG TPA: hypothetical protein VJ810_04545 [Blastocatellia bacterium]|nr:hypothetical protein [Blastocatellia bacterium]
MKHNFIRYSIYSVIALLIGLSVLSAIRANAERRNSTIDVESWSWGQSSNAVPRVNVVNFGDEPIIASIELLDKEGKAFARSGEIQVAPGHTTVFDPGFVGGVTVARARIFVKFTTDKPFDVNRDRAPFGATVEVVNSATGEITMIPTQWTPVAR